MLFLFGKSAIDEVTIVVKAREEAWEFWNVGGCSRLKIRIRNFEFHAMQEFAMSLQRLAHRTNGLKMGAVT